MKERIAFMEPLGRNRSFSSRHLSQIVVVRIVPKERQGVQLAREGFWVTSEFDIWPEVPNTETRRFFVPPSQVLWLEVIGE